jgi:hypothetical protein
MPPNKTPQSVQLISRGCFPQWQVQAPRVWNVIYLHEFGNILNSARLSRLEVVPVIIESHI